MKTYPMMTSGIYQITNQVNGKRYIGSSVNLRKRWRDHLSALRYKRHGNRHLQRAFDKHSETIFVFSVLEHVEDSAQLVEREQHYFDMLSPEYNLSLTADPRYSLGHHHSKETRKKMSESRRKRHDRWSDPEYCEKYLAAIKEKYRKLRASPDYAARMAEAEEMFRELAAREKANPRQYTAEQIERGAELARRIKGKVRVE